MMLTKGDTEKTYFVHPDRCAQAVAELFGRRMNSIVLVVERGQIVYTDVFPSRWGLRPGEPKQELTYTYVTYPACEHDFDAEAMVCKHCGDTAEHIENMNAALARSMEQAS